MNDKLLKDIFDKHGIFILEQDYSEELCLDSLQFVSIVVAIENTFSVQICDTYLINGKLKTFNDFLLLVNTLTTYK